LSLRRRLVARINALGPITVAEYMDACLNDPRYGYYATHPALGAAGDFITAPHVSQMFGELIGAWAAEVWRRLGSPPRVRLVELGPGDGTMMSDILRSAEAWPRFQAAIDLLLLEKSGPLRAAQAASLRGRWISGLDEIGEDAPVIIVANEFLDCFPIRQALMGADGWRERRIGVGPSGDLEFIALEPRPEIERTARPGDVFEWSPDLAALASQIGALVTGAGGAALFVDYAGDGLGDTLQSIGSHRRVSPLSHPGQNDLTARVDFGAFLAASTPAKAFGPIAQATFLLRLGLEARAAALARPYPNRAAKILRQVRRLISPRQMGELFQVACIAAPDIAPPGFAQ
jgi:SAM-dependent MidA family methyltransferase